MPHVTDGGTLGFNIAIKELDPIFVARQAGGIDHFLSMWATRA